jgi:hypothetical protein
MIIFTSEKFLFLKKKGVNTTKMVAINGGGGLAGYICPWLPHLP